MTLGPQVQGARAQAVGRWEWSTPVFMLLPSLGPTHPPASGAPASRVLPGQTLVPTLLRAHGPQYAAALVAGCGCQKSAKSPCTESPCSAPQLWGSPRWELGLSPGEGAVWEGKEPGLAGALPRPAFLCSCLRYLGCLSLIWPFTGIGVGAARWVLPSFLLISQSKGSSISPFSPGLWHL